MATPLVSIVVPCFNQGQYIADALQSIEQQTHRNYEILVVDDGSDDCATIEALDRLAERGYRIIRSDNRGPAAARNLAMAIASGKYLLPLDGDDRIAPTYLEKAVEVLENDSSVGVVYCLAEFFGVQSGLWPLPPFALPDFIFQPSVFNAAVFRREDWQRLGGYCESMRTGYEDHDLWLGMLELGRTIHRIDEVLFYYRRTPGSLSQAVTLEQKVNAFTTMFQRHPALFARHIDGLFRLYHIYEAATQARHLRVLLQVFFPSGGGYDEDHSIRVEYAGGNWIVVRVEVPPFAGLSPTSLRIDPGMQDGFYRINQLKLTATEADGAIQTTVLDGPTLARLVEVGGTAIRLPATDDICLYSFGKDPQLVVSDLTLPTNSRTLPISLLLRIRYDPSPENYHNDLTKLRDILVSR